MKKTGFLNLALLICLSIFCLLSDVYGQPINKATAPNSAVVNWKPEHIFASYEDYSAELADLDLSLTDFENSCKGTMEHSSDTFEKCYLGFYSLYERTLKVYFYVYLHSTPSSSDLSFQFRSTESQKASAIYRKFLETTAFVMPEIKELGSENINTFIAEKPSLEKYRYDLTQILRRGEHIISPDAGIFIAGYDNILEQTARMNQAIWDDIQWNDFISGEKHLLKFLPIKIPKKEKINTSEWMKLRRSPDRRIRQSATEAFNNSLLKSKETITQQLISVATVENETAAVQNYDSVMQMKLDKDNLDPAVYDQLIETVRKNIEQTMHKYVSLKKNTMGLDNFKYYDNYVMMTRGFKPKPSKITYSQARTRIAKALEPLGNNYVNIFNKASDPKNGWVFINPERTSGGNDGTLSSYGIHPYILLFFSGDYDDMFTVAHEFGHAIHAQLSSDQPMPYFYPSPFISEVASSVNEILLYDYLVSNAEKSANLQEEMYLLELLIDRIRMTLFRFTQLAEFEKIIYEKVRSKEILYFDYIRKIYAGLMDDYYGPDFILDYSSSIQWAYPLHLYPSFYVYSYATSTAAAIEFVKMIREDHEKGSSETIMKYLNFLKSGSSDSPIKMLQKAGIDFSTDKPIQDACNFFSSLLDAYVNIHKRVVLE